MSKFIAEEYEMPILVGEGGGGKVYRLKNKKTGDFYALKILDNRKMWENETNILMTADHNLFPQIFDHGEEDGKFYILMEYVWGDLLSEVLLRRKGLAQAEAMRMALSIADGLGWLQTKDRPVVFRDLKADNIILSPDGNVRLVDLGSACYVDEMDSTITGTRGISAPEQFEGKAGLYSDVYAFGRLFHFMLTGDLKPEIDEKTNRLKSIREYDPMLSPVLELLIDDCTGVSTSERLPDMYCVTQRIVEIATMSPRAYKKMEKQAEKILSSRSCGSEILYGKNVRM